MKQFIAKYLKFTRYKIDGWHLANSLSIMCFCAAIVTHKPCLFWFWEWAVAGALFNLCFNLFYNKVLKA